MQSEHHISVRQNVLFIGIAFFFVFSPVLNFKSELFYQGFFLQQENKLNHEAIVGAISGEKDRPSLTANSKKSNPAAASSSSSSPENNEEKQQDIINVGPSVLVLRKSFENETQFEVAEIEEGFASLNALVSESTTHDDQNHDGDDIKEVENSAMTSIVLHLVMSRLLMLAWAALMAPILCAALFKIEVHYLYYLTTPRSLYYQQRGIWLGAFVGTYSASILCIHCLVKTLCYGLPLTQISISSVDDSGVLMCIFGCLFGIISVIADGTPRCESRLSGLNKFIHLVKYVEFNARPLNGTSPNTPSRSTDSSAVAAAERYDSNGVRIMSDDVNDEDGTISQLSHVTNNEEDDEGEDFPSMRKREKSTNTEISVEESKQLIDNLNLKNAKSKIE
jgi:hypothetical protein